MDNETLYEQAMEAITNLYSDNTVSKSECKENMKELVSEIECMIEALNID